jgi:membrane associated rhomboid family serine protease
MKDISDLGLPPNIKWPCPWSTTSNASDPSMQCSLDDLCGFPPLGDPPNQWFRFIVPIFLHGGIIHIGFNMLLQLTLGREMEKIIGPLRFLLVYMASGIFGFVLGGNFAANGIVSMGASGSLFGIIAINLLDLLYTWRERVSPWKELIFILIDIIISFVLGLLPGLDNFSHIGGFLMGLVLGVCILHTPNILRETTPETSVESQPAAKKSRRRRKPRFKQFAKDPVGFFKDRKPLWWAWWFVRAGALLAVFICFILLLNNFYKYGNTCSWCKYLSCINVNNWCDVGNLNSQIQRVPSNSQTSSRRDLFSLTNSLPLQL